MIKHGQIWIVIKDISKKYLKKIGTSGVLSWRKKTFPVSTYKISSPRDEWIKIQTNSLKIINVITTFRDTIFYLPDFCRNTEVVNYWFSFTKTVQNTHSYTFPVCLLSPFPQFIGKEKHLNLTNPYWKACLHHPCHMPSPSSATP